MKPEYKYHNAWLEYRQAVDEDFADFEQRTGLTLPNDLREFIKEAGTKSPRPRNFPIFGNPAEKDSDCTSFYGFPGNVKLPGVEDDREAERAREYRNLFSNWEIFQGRIPAVLLPFGYTSFGDQICYKLKGDDAGSIWVWFHDEEYELEEDEEPPFDNCYFCAPTLDAFLEGFFDDISME